MIKKGVKIAAFILVALAQLAVPLYTLYNVWNIKRESIKVRLTCRPVDPYNFMQGRYVILAFDEDNKAIRYLPSLKNYSEKRLKALEGEEVYCILRDKGEMSRFYIKDIVESKPLGHGHFVKAEVKRVLRKSNGDWYIELKFAFNRYFLQEEYAPLAEKVLRRSRGDGMEFEPLLTISIGPEGDAVVEALDIQFHENDRFKELSIEDYIDRELKAGRLTK